MKIIEPEGTFIKKNQILSLQNDFSKHSQYTNYNIYIINNCEKMNKDAANTILKFLEEPNDNTLGFFITKNVDDVIPTVVSRCQILKCNFENTKSIELNISLEKYNEYYDFSKELINKIESNSTELIIDSDFIKKYDKADYINIFSIILDIYRSVLHNDNETIKEFSYIEILPHNKIIKKIELLIEMLKEMNYNVNIDMLLDRFFIEMDGINNEVL